MPPLGETLPAAAGRGVLGGKNGMTAVGGLTAVVGNHAGRKTLGDDGPGMRFDHGRAPELGRQPILLREAKARTKTGGGEPPEGVLKARIRVGHGRGPQPPKGQRFVTERMRRLPTGSAASALARFTASMLSAEAVKRSIRPFSPTKGSPCSSRP